MTANQEDYIRYLASKKSVDDRALNQAVLSALARRLVPGTPDRPVRILEIAAGIGTMVERLCDLNLLQQADITLVEPNGTYLAECRKRLSRWADLSGRRIGWKGETLPNGPMQDNELALTLVPADLEAFLSRTASGQTWDLVMAHAFLDLTDLTFAIPGLCRLACPGGLLYLSINYDGKTRFWPDMDPDFERCLLDLYNQSMERRRICGRPTGASRTGRRLLGTLMAAGAELISAGRSDWLVFATDKTYCKDEAYFLTFILATIRDELKGHPDLDRSRLQRWYEQRRAQIKTGQLIYLAKNMDFLARRTTESQMSDG
jgi:SAM-dependent methyltransferase